VYTSGVEDPVAVHLPKPLVERLDVVAKTELRSRANAAAWLIAEGLRRREPADVEPKEG
jgi:metal-responsive CopG/Arc/MetJ family transcriptional regulator